MSSIFDDLTFDRTEVDLDADAGLDASADLDPDPVMDAVARLLALAAQNADELLAEANAEAVQIKALAGGADGDDRPAGGGPGRG